VQGAILALGYSSLVTLGRLVTGLVIGVTIAIVLAVVITWSRLLLGMFLLPAHGMRMLPLLAMSPLFGIWYGNSFQGAIAFIAFGTFAIMFVVAMTALAAVPNYYVQYARALGASRLRAYLTTVLPASLPGMRGGILLAVGFGWSMTLAAEFLGASTGLGKIVNVTLQFGQNNSLALVAFFIIIYAVLMAKVVSIVFDRLVRWTE
jgi:ABC-type nitrate/sulfonate/bicarbonate transport system permease component